MKKLILIRHGKSSWADPGMRDIDRPLNDRGRRDAPFMGKSLAETLEGPPDLVLSSPALRARTTAAAVVEAMGVQGLEIQLEARIYEAGVGDLLEVVQGLDDVVGTAMLFGHNPGFEDFAGLLTGSPMGDFPTLAVAEIDLDIERWAECEPGCGEMVLFVSPKMLPQ